MSRVHAISDATRRFLAEPRPFLVNGQWVRSDASTPSIDPATGAEIGRFHAGSVDDVARAVAAARASFDDARWRGLTPAARQRILWRVAELIDANVTQLAELECLDGGKVFSSARDHEVPHAAETFRYYAGWCTKLDGHTFQPSVPGTEFHGQITAVFPAADKQNRSFDVEVSIPNSDYRLRPNMIVSLHVNTREAASAQPVVPLNAVLKAKNNPTGYAIFVVTDEGGRQVARLRDIKLGQAYGNTVAVTAGVKQGELVITTGSTMVLDGVQVKVIP